MKTTFLSATLALVSLFASAQEKHFTREQYKEDFNFFWRSINDDYCYFEKKRTDWVKVKTLYSPALDTITTRSQFVTLIEQALGEIYDHHASLNTNTDLSQRLVPSGTDLWAAYVHGKPTILQVRRNYGAEVCGIVAGMEVAAINDVPVARAIRPFIPKSLKVTDTEALNYALRSALAGNHITARKLTMRTTDGYKDYFPDTNGMLLEHIRYKSKIESRIVNSIGYIKINNCLYDDDLVGEFDSVMHIMRETKGLVLDMRETPSGGNTTVARAILGWFTNKEQYYQKHELYAEEKQTGVKRNWVEIVSPRPGKYYSKPLVVLADHWTGSIAEGITIGFSAMKRAKIIGTPMARLNGAVYTYEMPDTKIKFSFPVERLYHVDGQPRELFIPDMNVNIIGTYPKTDVPLQKAMNILTGKDHTL